MTLINTFEIFPVFEFPLEVILSGNLSDLFPLQLPKTDTVEIIILDTGIRQLYQKTQSGLQQLTQSLFDVQEYVLAGDRLFFTASDGTDQEVYKYQLETGKIEQLTDNNYDDQELEVIDDWLTWKGGSDDKELHVYELNSGLIQQITEDNDFDNYYHIHGDYIYWMEQNSQEKPDLFVYNGREITRLTNNSHETWFALSDLETYQENLVVWDLTDGNDKEIYLYNEIEVVQLTNDSFNNYVWETRGDYIIGLTAFDDTSQAWLYDGNNFSSITDAQHRHRNGKFWGDNRIILTREVGEAQEILIYNIDSQSTQILPSSSVYNRNIRMVNPGESDNLAWIAENSSGDREVFVYSQGKVKQITNNGSREYFSTFSSLFANEQFLVFSQDDTNDNEGLFGPFVGDEIFIYNYQSEELFQLTENNGETLDRFLFGPLVFEFFEGVESALWLSASEELINSTGDLNLTELSELLRNDPTVQEQFTANLYIPDQAVIKGTKTDDTLTGTTTTDLIKGEAGNDRLQGDAKRDYLLGDGGADTLEGGNGEDSLSGGEGADTLLGGRGSDTLLGNQGDDFLQGDESSDLLFGNRGNDTISGDRGRDILFGGEGKDRLKGGHQRDQYYFYTPEEGGDRLIGFNPSQDLIAIAASGFDSSLNQGYLSPEYFTQGSQAKNALHRFFYNSGELWFDSDGVGSEVPILIASFNNSPSLTAEHIVLF